MEAQRTEAGPPQRGAIAAQQGRRGEVTAGEADEDKLVGDDVAVALPESSVCLSNAGTDRRLPVFGAESWPLV